MQFLMILFSCTAVNLIVIEKQFLQNRLNRGQQNEIF